VSTSTTPADNDWLDEVVRPAVVDGDAGAAGVDDGLAGFGEVRVGATVPGVVELDPGSSGDDTDDVDGVVGKRRCGRVRTGPVDDGDGAADERDELGGALERSS
jgi:hypothetical protein